MTELERESKRFTENMGGTVHNPTYFSAGPLTGQIKDCDCGLFGKQTRLGRSHDNPTYTIGLIRSELERCGKWDMFKFWLYGKAGYNFPVANRPEGVLFMSTDYIIHADILTTPLLLLQAANGYIYECKLIKREEK